MRFFLLLVLAIALAACRGEPVPRDYQNHPSTMTNPPATKGETPGGHNLGNTPPQPSTGVEGTTGPYEPVNPTAGEQTTTVPDTTPVTTTT